MRRPSGLTGQISRRIFDVVERTRRAVARVRSCCAQRQPRAPSVRVPSGRAPSCVRRRRSPVL